MVVQKSDAMLQYEKGIGELLKTRPKRSKEIMILPEAKELIIAAAVIVVVVAAALAII